MGLARERLLRVLFFPKTCRLLPNATAALIQSASLLYRDRLRSAELVDALTLLAEVAVEQDDLRSAYDFVCMALEDNCDNLRLTNLAGTRFVGIAVIPVVQLR